MISLKLTDRETWNKYWSKVSRAPLLQSWEYGDAKCQSRGFRPQRFLLENETGEPAGLLQSLVYSLPVIGRVARINRGPVFFRDFLRESPSQEDVREVMIGIQEAGRHQRWRLLRIAPEFLANESIIATFVQLGFKKRATSPAASALIDINRNHKEIRGGFHGKWRNLLKKSEKLGLELEVPSLSEAFPFLLKQYEAMQQEKEFEGVASSLLRAMIGQEGPSWTCQILFAVQKGQRHGAVMTVGHGDTCTYLIGWTSDEGRRLQANYFLLWQAMLAMREREYRYFDVGGLGAQTTSGVEHFKKRLKGEEYSLIGEYSWSSIPFLK